MSGGIRKEREPYASLTKKRVSARGDGICLEHPVETGGFAGGAEDCEERLGERSQ